MWNVAACALLVALVHPLLLLPDIRVALLVPFMTGPTLVGLRGFFGF